MSELFCTHIPVEVRSNQVRVEVEPSAAVRPIVNTDYDALENKPQINGVELSGNKTSAELGIDQTYIYEQTSAAAVWTITHNLGRYPSVTVVDSAGSECVGEVTYLDENTVQCTFSAPFGGKAYLN